jgi:hypothetical protein
MPHAAIRYSPALCLLSALFTAPLFAQGVQQTADAAAASTAAPIAFVYVGTSKGTHLYNAASNGRLTLVSGSPFKTTGLMIGSNQKYFITVGTYWVRSYAVKANGAIGAQLSQINTQNYSGRECGTTNGAVLGHTGQDVYVLLNVPPDGNNVCNAYQSFKIATSGQLTFNGATTHDTKLSFTGPPPVRNLPTILANNKYAYAINNFVFVTSAPVGTQDIYTNDGTTFTRASNGTLLYRNFEWPFPAPYGGFDLYRWIPVQVTADPTNHLAVAMYPWYDPPKGSTENPQLASYTVDSQGNIATTNTWKNMPSLNIFPTVLNMSPGGKLLAVGGSRGLQVFHFNGGAPITRYSKVLTTDQVNWIRWDKANHLYALSTNGKLYVYTITATSIAAAPGSPYTISGPAALFVVPR